MVQRMWTSTTPATCAYKVYPISHCTTHRHAPQSLITRNRTHVHDDLGGMNAESPAISKQQPLNDCQAQQKRRSRVQGEAKHANRSTLYKFMATTVLLACQHRVALSVREPREHRRGHQVASCASCQNVVHDGTHFKCAKPFDNIAEGN